MIEKDSFWPKEGEIPQIGDFTEKNGNLSYGPYILKNTEHGWETIVCKAGEDRYEKVTISENNPTSVKALSALQQYIEAHSPEKEVKKNPLVEEYYEYARTHSIKNIRASFVTCNTCRSSLNKKMLLTNRCPLCGNDLRSKQVLDKLAQFRERIKQTPA